MLLDRIYFLKKKNYINTNTYYPMKTLLIKILSLFKSYEVVKHPPGETEFDYIPMNEIVEIKKKTINKRKKIK